MLFVPTSRKRQEEGVKLNEMDSPPTGSYNILPYRYDHICYQ